jgi:hypothetical protein
MPSRPAPVPAYDWLMAIASLWLSGGIMLDAWYHFHSTVETFFEPAHAVLYAGLLASYVFTGVFAATSRKHGYAWRNVLPAGYGVTLAGLAVCLAGGLGDMIKHTLWGFEEGFDALLSPTHLLIGAGMFLIIAGPIGSALRRPHPPRTLVAQLPLLLCAGSMMELMHWGLQFIFLSEAERMNAPIPPASMPHDTLTLLALQYYKQGIGLLAVIVQSLLISGFFLYLARRIRLAAGANAVLLVTGNVFIAAAHSNDAGQFIAVILASAVAGLVADAFRLDPANQTTRRWSAAAFCVPAAYWIAALALLALTMGGIWWTPDVVAGSILFAGFAGLFVNAAAGPFARPAA